MKFIICVVRYTKKRLMSSPVEPSDPSNSSQTLKDLIESTRKVFPTDVGDFHQHVGTGTNMACESYKKVDPSGKNPECFADSSSCSIATYTNEKLEVPMCYWHAVRIGSIFPRLCGCKTNYCLGGDSISRNFVYQLLEKLNVEVDGPNNGVCDMGGFYCCRDARSGAIDTPYECGFMSVCEDCRAHHDPTCLHEIESEEYDPDWEPVIDGPVPYLPPGIFGIRRGNGWVVKMADSKTGGYEITSYRDAIKVHSKFLETGDSRADAWYALASHMPDRPSYIQPMVALSS